MNLKYMVKFIVRGMDEWVGKMKEGRQEQIDRNELD